MLLYWVLACAMEVAASVLELDELRLRKCAWPVITC